MVKSRCCSHGQNIACLVGKREHGPYGGLGSVQHKLEEIAEDKAATYEMEEIHCKLPTTVRSTFLVTFSPDGTKVASTHGDHKIYICDVKTGRLLHTLEGHPRTPWCLAFHPSSNDILASGCLGGEVRVWDLHGGSEVWVSEQNTVITSLVFHPTDKVLVFATFNKIHFWDWSRPTPFATCKTASDKEKVRFVKFDPLGAKLITGISNFPMDTFRTRVLDSLLGPGLARPPPARSIISQRRSILTRLMSMYRHLERLEELSRLQESRGGATSPTHEEVLQQAREYAEEVTAQSRLWQHHHPFYSLEEVLGARDESMEQQPGTSGYRLLEQNSQTEPEGDASVESVRETLTSPSQENQEHNNNDFWATFQRLRFICNRLERRMQQHQESDNVQSSSNEEVPRQWNRGHNNGADSTSQDSRGQNGAGTERHEAQVTGSIRSLDSSADGPQDGQDVPVSLVSLLTRLQQSLQSLSSAALTTAVAREQIHQVRQRISEILERLANVSGYRARLTSLRDQIYEAAERMVQRGEDNSPSQRWDLAHCLWLVEMSLQLTRQMQRILAADYRLTQLHLSATSQSLTASDPSTGRTASSSHGTSDQANDAAAARGATDSPPSISQLNSHTVTVPSLFTLSRRASVESPRPVHRTERMPNPFHRLHDLGTSSGSWHENDTSPFFWRRQHLLANRSNGNMPNQREASSGNASVEDVHRPPSRLGRPATTTQELDPQSGSDSGTGIWRQHSRHGSDLSVPSTSGLIWPSNQREASSLSRVMSRTLQTETVRDEEDDSSGSSSDDVSNSGNDNWWLRRGDRRRVTSAQLRQQDRSPRFLVPEVQVEPSTSPPRDSAPLPPQERPRSPPLSAILAGNDLVPPPLWGRVPPYLSMLYDTGLRPRIGSFLGIGESAHNLTHRIQCWDFSKYHVPCISDAEANMVVSKCKIHNDASVDISSSGELLAALVPSTASLTHSVMLAIYSLSSCTLGNCLYTWSFGPNAISVSLSPLGHYVVVGLASSRLYLATTEREVVAQIFKLDSQADAATLMHVRNLSQQGGGQQPQISLNSVHWLPHPGQGLIYGTNRGTLCICRPLTCQANNSQAEVKRPKPRRHVQPSRTPQVPQQRDSSRSALPMLSTATQTMYPSTQTTGTQTVGANTESGSSSSSG